MNFTIFVHVSRNYVKKQLLIQISATELKTDRVFATFLRNNEKLRKPAKFLNFLIETSRNYETRGGRRWPCARSSKTDVCSFVLGDECRDLYRRWNKTSADRHGDICTRTGRRDARNNGLDEKEKNLGDSFRYAKRFE